MPLHRIPLEELRLACRQKLGTCELWLRRLIHDELSQHFGPTYFGEGVHNGNHIFRMEIRNHAAQRLSANPERYRREVDTLLIEQIVDTICKQDLYNLCFSVPLRQAYPDGREETRTFLGRLIPIRNALSHANPISVHDAERVICYCDDIIGSLKQHYSDKNMSNEYNAPSFTRFSDGFGHSEIPTQVYDQFLNYSKDTRLRPGEIVRLEVEVDSSFDPNDYTVEWRIPTGEVKLGSSIEF